LYSLGKNIEIQEELYREIKDKNTAEALEQPLLKEILKETLRMYPVAPFVTRYTPQQVLIDNYLIEKDVS